MQEIIANLKRDEKETIFKKVDKLELKGNCTFMKVCDAFYLLLL